MDSAVPNPAPLRRVTRLVPLPARWLAGSVAGLLAVGLAGCSQDVVPSGATASSPRTVVSSSVSVSASVSSVALIGEVRDGRGAPLAGTLVSAAGQQATTAADGRFALTVEPSGTTMTLLARHAGYSTVAREVPVTAGARLDVPIRLFASQVTKRFAAAAGATITTRGAQVRIPPGTLTRADGSIYAGTVTADVSYFSPDTAEGVQAFPAPYRGMDGSERMIRSVGVIETTLTDPDGAPLLLREGAPATLRFPPSSVAREATTVPLWFYDEQAQVWQRDGSATRQGDGTLQGTVSHFTVWNADIVIDSPATLRGCFVDPQGKPVSMVFAGVRGIGWFGTMGLPGADGRFEAAVPSGVALELYSIASPVRFAPVPIRALARGEVRQLPCVVIEKPAATLTFALPLLTLPSVLSTAGAATTPGRPTPTRSAAASTGQGAFTGTYRGTYSGAESGTFLARVDSAGRVSGQTVSSTYPGVIGRVSGRIAGDGSLSLTARGTSGAAEFSGTISRTGTVTGSWRYVQGQLSGGGTFTGSGG